MKRITVASLAVVLALWAVPAMAQQEHARYDFPTELVGLGGSGGAIALDKRGNFATPYTETGMYRGWVREDGVVEVRIYER